MQESCYLPSVLITIKKKRGNKEGSLISNFGRVKKTLVMPNVNETLHQLVGY